MVETNCLFALRIFHIFVGLLIVFSLTMALKKKLPIVLGILMLILGLGAIVYHSWRIFKPGTIC